PEKIQDLLVDHIEKNQPSGVEVTVKKEKLSSKAYKVEPNHPSIQTAAACYERAFEQETVFVRMGVSIPVVELVYDIYDVAVVLLGFGTPEDRLHSPNESFPLDSFDQGMKTLAYYYEEVSKK